ncbi:MAG: AI-2E family transporter, partial [Tumebacillaceae bacterium]
LFIIFGVGVLMRQILEPKILAESIGLDPLITLVTMYAGYQAIGFIGVILAPFLIITVTSMLKVKAFDFLIDDDDLDDQHPPKPPETT